MPADSQSHDVAVIGGGIIGLAVAWRARQRGLSVCVLDRGELAGGATRVAAGMLAPVAEADPQERALLALGMQSARAWPAFAEELRDVTGIDVGYRACGTLVVARDRDDAEALERELALRERLGLAVERVLPSQARRMEGALAPTIRAAFHAPDDNAVDARASAVALVAAAEHAGALLRPGCAVERVEPGAVVLEDGARVAAERVVVAAGAWSGTIPGLPNLPIRPVKGQTLRLRRQTSESHDAPLIERVVRFEGGYLVPRADGRVVLGATVEERGYDTAMTAGGIYELLRDAAEVVPGVLEMEVEETLAGLRPGTPDNAPLLGTIDEGVLVASGHYRNGILLAPVSADLIVAELCGEDADHAFRPDRFGAGVIA